MARRVSSAALESRSARLRLKIRRRPYSGPSLARGISLMYRRNKTNGTWVLKASNGHGAYWTKAFALADDFEDADAKNVLTFYQAQDQAKKLARGGDGGTDGAPITVDGALKAYRRDLEAREANPYNADWPRATPHQRAAEQARGAADGRRTEEVARGLLGTMAPPRSIASVAACVPHWNRRRNPTSAFRTGMLGKPALLVCRMRKKRETSFCLTTRCSHLSPPLTRWTINWGC